jgi:hypothetical protein
MVKKKKKINCFHIYIFFLQIGLATTVNWASNFIVSITFLSYQDAVGPTIAFWTYGIICVVAIVVFYFKLPETKGRTFEEIQLEFQK